MSQQHRKVISELIARCQIEVAVAVEVDDHESHRFDGATGALGHRLCPQIEPQGGAKRAVSQSQEYRDVVRKVIHRHQIQTLVAVQIGHSDIPGSHPDGKRHSALERPVPQTQQHGHVIRHAIGRDHVEPPITVQVDGHNRLRVGSHLIARHAKERSVSTPQQDRHLVVAAVRYRQVVSPVTVEIGDDNSLRLVPHGKLNLVPKGSVSVIQKDRDVVGVFIQNGQVGPRVAVEISRADRFGILSRKECLRLRLKRPVAVTEQQGDAGCLVADHRQVKQRVAVAAEMPRDQRPGAVRHGKAQRRAALIAKLRKPVFSFPPCFSGVDQDGNVVRPVIRDGQIDVAVRVEVGGRDAPRRSADLDLQLIDPKAALAVAQQNGHRVGFASVRSRQIDSPVAVEVGGDNRLRSCAGS